MSFRGEAEESFLPYEKTRFFAYAQNDRENCLDNDKRRIKYQGKCHGNNKEKNLAGIF